VARKARAYMLLNLSAVHSGLAKSLLKVAFFFLAGENIALNEVTKHRGFYGCSCGDLLDEFYLPYYSKLLLLVL